MYLARVIGTVVATRKAQDMDGIKLLVVEPLSVTALREHKRNGEPHVAIDTVQAGEGDLVSCVGSREAALAAPRVGPTSFVPVDAAIIGIVDHADVRTA
jgi:microcompartment protein CcmK/EutM